MLYSFLIEISLLLLRVVALFSKKIAHFLSVRIHILDTIQEKINDIIQKNFPNLSNIEVKINRPMFFS
jgi:hypothetical protein